MLPLLTVNHLIAAALSSLSVPEKYGSVTLHSVSEAGELKKVESDAKLSGLSDGLTAKNALVNRDSRGGSLELSGTATFNFIPWGEKKPYRI